MTAPLLIRRVRLVPVDGAPGGAAPAGGPVPAGTATVDLLLDGGRVVEVGASLRPPAGADVLDGEGRWAVPGLWDQHVHLGQVARTSRQVDLTTAPGATAALAALRARLATDPRDIVVGYGMWHARWADPPTLDALDGAAAGRAVVVISGDVHCGWVSTRAQELLGLSAGAADDDGLVRESAWFEALARLAVLDPADPADYRAAVAAAAARGIVGVTDMEFAPNVTEWPDRVGPGLDRLRVRAATYPDTLDDALAAGLRTGDALATGDGLLTMGPLKVISDGSLNTATAHVFTPYPVPTDPAHPRGVQNVGLPELTGLVSRATAGGIGVAVHAIGDAAVEIALEAIEAARARGSIEHAQLLAAGQARRFAALGVTASVQPAHLLDERELTEERWPGRGGDVYPLRTLLDAGATVVLGSDAPVAPLDPWLAMAGAVHRADDDREPWHPEQHLTAAEALAASTDGCGTLAPGSRADVALLEDDPLRPGTTAEVAARLRGMRVAATVVAGRVAHTDLSR